MSDTSENPSARKRVIDPEAKQTAILGAAQLLFARDGFERTVIAAIAKEADVAVGSVHRIFGDKHRLLAAAQAEIEQRFTRAMVEGWRQPGPLPERFRAMLRALFDEMARLRHFMPIMDLKAEGASFSHGAVLRAGIGDLMREAIDKGELRPVPVDISATIAFGMVDAAMRATAAVPDPHRVEVTIDVLADMLERALASSSTTTPETR